MAFMKRPRDARGGGLYTAQRTLLATAIASSLCLPASVLAQEGLEEIVVTARFREENLQQTPLAITAITGDMLEARGATSTLDLDAFVPNAVIAPLGAGWGSTAAAFIRGIGLGDNSLSFEPGVPIYIDDVYHGRPQGAVLDLLDIDRVEVLRGPQGTLFGKNTLGGAVRIISKKPEGSGSGFVDVQAGERDRLNFRGSYDFPIVEDKVLARISASSKKQDGYFDILDYECVNGPGSLGLGGPGVAAGTNGVARPAGNPDPTNPAWIAFAANTHPAIGGVRLGSVLGTTDARGCVVDHFGNENVQSGRVALRFLASDTVEVNVVADLTYSDQEGPPDKYTVQLRTTDGVPPGVAAQINGWNNTIAIPVFGAGGQFDGRFQTPDKYTSYHRFGQDPLTGRITPNRNELKHTGLQVDLDWDLSDNVSFKSTTAYRDFDNSFGRDSDGTPLPGTFTWDTSKHEQFTQEFQLSGITGADDGLEWTTGLFYYDAFDSNQGYNNGYVYTSSFSDHKDEQDLTNYAVFAHFVWAITEKLNLSTGVRYTDDQKDATIYRRTGNTAPAGIGAPQFVLIDNGLITVESQEWSPKLSFDYQFTATTMGYVQLSTGFRGGGFSPRPANALQLTAFQPEFIDNFEVGVKTDWLDGRLRFNGDVYYMKNRDKQQAIADCAPCAPTRVNSFPTVNTGESRNWGLEGEILAEPVDNLRIDFSLGYQDYKVTDLGRSSGIFITVPDTTGDPSIRGDVLYSPRTPEWNVGLGISYPFRVGSRGATLTPRFDYTWQDDIWFTTNPVAGIVTEEDGRQPAYGVLNARVTWDAPNTMWSASAYALNLTDEYYFYGKLSLLGNSGREQGNPAPPREVGVSIRFNF
ncbi:MAG TPA: TonB-dependent receptor [Gammaproteobacteria bacterium]|nr:TonB-dependent receptor [Gammaproteobacteria bacterium]